ncbi:outer membrane beta-barrel protein [Cellulophaga sp. Z1A5H]|uniref:outer membrane beta-barrel protein n=1 Tax=Cellulophaga sp. Z1A5H TaxID=2687291 RepID=UPI0013FD8F57|nr:outer membrane beta-barrel protein [Cellulophaga sp. Z1A5H]
MKAITKTNYVKNIFFAAVLFTGASLVAQEEVEEKKAITISGSADAYFRTNLSATDEADADGAFINPGSSFAEETGFALGMANIIASYDMGKTGVVADLVFGPRGEAATFNQNVINQLYAYWNVSEGTTITAGRFNTFLGYEVISPVANMNYSTSYLFSNGPFSHVGVKADFALSEDFSLMLAVTNVADVNNNFTGVYALGAQLGYSGQFLNFYYDGGEFLGLEVDYTGGFDLSEDFFLGINAAYADSDGAGFAGAALYPQLATSDSFKLGLRGEYFSVFDGVDGTDDPSVFAATLTGSYSIENLTIKPEVRLDSWSDNEPYFDTDGAASKSLSSFLIAAIYSF